MRWFAALVLLLAPPSSFAQMDCVEGMVILRLVPSQTTSPGLLAASPPQFGIASVDEVLGQHGPTAIHPFLVSPSGAQSTAVDELTRTYVVYYSDEENPHVVVAELSSSPAIEAVFVNGLVTKYYGGTERVLPDDTAFEHQWNLDNADDRVDIDAPEAYKPGLTLPTHYSLGASQPNPFNPVTTMTFDVPAPGGQVEIAIFDVKGSKVRTLVRGRHAVGTHAATWTGRDDSGEPVASGVYFVRMTAPSFTQTRKVVLLK